MRVPGRGVRPSRCSQSWVLVWRRMEQVGRALNPAVLCPQHIWVMWQSQIFLVLSEETRPKPKFERTDPAAEPGNLRWARVQLGLPLNQHHDQRRQKVID